MPNIILYFEVTTFLFFSLFILYSLSRNDFVLMRKNISVTKMFNYTFCFFILGFIIGRLLFILDTQNYSYLSPLIFFHLLKFHGISVLGIFLSAAIIYFLFIQDKVVIKRVLDIIYLSFLPLFSLNLLTASYTNIVFIKIVLFISTLLLLGALVILHKDYTVKDGSIALILLIMFSCFYFVVDFLTHDKPAIIFLTLTQIISLFMLVSCGVLLVLNENEQFLKKK